MTMVFIPKHIVDRLNSYSTEEVAERIGIGKVVRHKCKCFMHDDHYPSLQFLGNNRQGWRCFVCQKGGNGPISLTMAKEGLSFQDACLYLCRIYGIWIDGLQYRPYLRKKKTLSINLLQKETSKCKEDLKKQYREEVLNWIVNNAKLSSKAREFLFTERKLSEKIIVNLQISSISDSKVLKKVLFDKFPYEKLICSGLIKEETGNIKLFTPCLLFPYYDTDGDLIGLQSRYLGEIENAPRFQFISSQKSRIFNLPVINTMSHGDELYISEGVTDCLALLSDGYKSVALPSATIFPEEDLYKLRHFRLKMYADNDTPGMKCYYQLESYFIRFGCSITRIPLPEGYKDYADYHRSRLCYEC